MQRLMNGVVVLTADNENPDCMRCVNVQCGDGYCWDFCGAKNGWQGYEEHTTFDAYWKGEDYE